MDYNDQYFHLIVSGPGPSNQSLKLSNTENNVMLNVILAQQVSTWVQVKRNQQEKELTDCFLLYDLKSYISENGFDVYVEPIFFHASFIYFFIFYKTHNLI